MAAKPAVQRVHPPDLLMHAVNPVTRARIRRGRASGQLMLLHFTGRTTGRAYDVPIAQHHVRDGLIGSTSSRWRVNLRGGADIEVTLDGQRKPMRAELLEDPATVARYHAELIGQTGLRRARWLLGLKVNVNRVPTADELADAARRSGLSVIRLTPLTGT